MEVLFCTKLGGLPVSRLLLSLSAVVLFLSGCASGTFKERQQQREKMAVSTGMFCEFISGDLFPDLDVELSLQMAKRCDVNRNFTVTNYKNSSDHNGVLYCCALAGRGERKAAPVRRSTQAPKETPAAATPAKGDSSEELIIEE